MDELITEENIIPDFFKGLVEDIYVWELWILKL